MPRHNNQITAILNRLTKKLTPADRESITRSLVDYMVVHNLQADDLSPCDDLINVIIPGIVRDNVDWEGVTSIKDI